MSDLFPKTLGCSKCCCIAVPVVVRVPYQIRSGETREHWEAICSRCGCYIKFVNQLEAVAAGWKPIHKSEVKGSMFRL